MKILSLDLAEYKIGWAAGDAGTKPTYGSYKLRRSREERTKDALGRFAEWLDDALNQHRPQLAFAEDYLPGGALKGRTTFDTRDGAILLNGAMRAVCALNNVEVRCIGPRTIRKHFCGRADGEPVGTESSRDAAKRMVLDRCRLLGYLPHDCVDDDIADAIAGFDFASSHYGRAAGAFALTEKR